jgi:hypothetical protein
MPCAVSEMLYSSYPADVTDAGRSTWISSGYQIDLRLDYKNAHCRDDGLNWIIVYVLTIMYFNYLLCCFCYPQYFWLGHLKRLQEISEELCKKLETRKAAAVMFQKSALTIKELESIQWSKTPYEAAKILVTELLNEKDQNMYNCFLAALREINQHHIWSWLIYKGISMFHLNKCALVFLIAFLCNIITSYAGFLYSVLLCNSHTSFSDT